MYILCIIAGAAAIAHLVIGNQPKTAARVVDLLLLYILAFVVGIGGVIGFLGHTFRADQIALSIGWPSGNPFQFEVAVANLAFGILGLLSLRFSGLFRTAAGIGWSVFALGAAAGHLRELVVTGNHAVNNAGPILWVNDILIPFVILALLGLRYFLDLRSIKQRTVIPQRIQVSQKSGRFTGPITRRVPDQPRRPEYPARRDHPGRQERPSRPERPERQDRPDRNERHDRQQRPERHDRQGRPDRQERKPRIEEQSREPRRLEEPREPRVAEEPREVRAEAQLRAPRPPRPERTDLPPRPTVQFSPDARPVLTVGHAAHPLEQFVALLSAHGVKKVVDVRTVPKSRHNPQFNAETLPDELRKSGIEYLHLPSLGGLRRPKEGSANNGWRNSAFRGYADHMQTDEFKGGLEELITLGKAEQIVVMCAESVPWRCHRTLIADALNARLIPVKHIISASKASDHEITRWAKLVGTEIAYPADNAPAQDIPGAPAEAVPSSPAEPPQSLPLA